MFKTKFIATLLIVLAVLFGQVGGVLAAPAAQDTPPIEGTVTSITTETDTEGVTTVLVTVDGQTYRLSVADADALDLVSVDLATNTVTVDNSKIDQTITIDPTLVIVDEEVVDEAPFNPVAGMLASFFGITNAEVNQMHEDGYGFGLITQALWMTRSLNESETGDAELAGCILNAKKSGTYGDCFDFGDEPVPTNWGQFKKSLKDNKDKHNLGVIMSGHADDDGTDTQEKGNGKDKNKDKGNGKGKNK